MIKRINRNLAFILIIFLVSLICYLKFDTPSVRNEEKNIIDDRVIEINEEKNDIVNSTNDIKENQNNGEVEELKKKYHNDAIRAKLNIDYLGLNVVITQSNDNDYYLNHDAYNNKSDFGNPYLDYRIGSNLGEEKQINIYSHNSSNRNYLKYLPFSKLRLLLEKKNFDKVKDIKLYTKEKLIKYELYAVKVITNDNEHMILDARSEDLWQEHLNKLLKDTKYCKDDCHLSSNSKLLILQTCNYVPSNSYILVIARVKN